jgi:EAL and modified HD-GYP domain-containing signal transduction protein
MIGWQRPVASGEEQTRMNPTQVVVGRQPVFDANLSVVGYELLFRQGKADVAAPVGAHNGDAMTADAIYGALNIGVDRLVGDKLVFCNADRGVLTGAIQIPLPPERTVVEVLESVHFDAEIDAGCRALREAGFRIALDDFDWSEDSAPGLLEHAEIVKLDVRALGPDRAIELGELCRPFGVALLAEKVETHDELAFFLEHGFDLYQGYALAHPMTVSGTTLEAPAFGVLQLAAAVLAADSDVDEVETVVRRDPALCLQLLKVASIGPLGHTRRTVRTIREALVLLGTQRLRGWITLLMVRASRATAPDDLLTVLARARMCELLEERHDRRLAAFAFTAGLVSALDRMLGMPADKLVAALPLDESLLGAAFGTTGPIGRVVHTVIEFESGDSDEQDEQLREVAASALDWAAQSAGLLVAA